MDNNYKFFNLDKVNDGEILVKDSNGRWRKILLKNVLSIVYIGNHRICDNFCINLLRIDVEVNGKFKTYHFNFSETLPVEICGWTCKNFEQLDITIRNLIPVI